MDQQELTALIGKTATLMEQFERRCADIEQHQHALTQALQQIALQLPLAVRQSADELLQAVPGQLLDKVGQGLEQAVVHYQTRLHDAGTQLGERSRTLAGQVQRLETLHGHMAWKAIFTVVGSLALLLAGGIWLSGHYAKVIRDNQLSAELLKAYNAADVTLCGERLCANVDMQTAPVGPQQQYRPVRARR